MARRDDTLLVRPPLVPRVGLEPTGDGAWATSGFSPVFDVELDLARWAGTWILCEARLETEIEVVTSSIHVLRDDPDHARHVHPFSADARGKGHWIGYLPPDLAGLRFEPLAMAGRFRVADFTIRRLSRAALLGRAMPINPTQVARALYWRALGKRVRSRNRLEQVFHRPAAASYAAWIRENDTFSAADLDGFRREAASWSDPPLISIVMPVHDPAPRDLRAALDSIRAQTYPHWQLSVADDASRDRRVVRILDQAAAADRRIRVVHRPTNGHISAASNTAIEGVEGPWTALMDHDDLLPPHALHFVAREILGHPDADLVYSDEDKVDGRGRRYMPHFKSDWNEELFLTQNYVNHLGIYRTAILRRIGGFRVGLEGSQDHDLVLRFLDHTSEERIRHIPRILYHWRNYRRSGSFSEKSLDKAIRARRRSLVDHVARRGWAAEVVEGPNGTNRLRRALPDPPPAITAIVPTRDRAALLRVATRGLLAETDYPRLALIVIDNESREPETLALFDELRADPRVTIASMPGPFNFSALNNRAVATARSELVLFLNNDVEVIEPEWLAEMASSMIPGVAAVGAKLLYPDRTVQHAGIVLGAGGVAGHAHPDRADRDPGYFGRAELAQYMSGVTAACMLVRREAFEAAGGFDAEHLAVAFNDVDLCLKLRAAGHKIIFDPHAKLIHHESASRGLDEAPEKRERFEREIDTMLDRWGPVLRRDPYYNPNLALDFADYRLRGVTTGAVRRAR